MKRRDLLTKGAMAAAASALGPWLPRLLSNSNPNPTGFYSSGTVDLIRRSTVVDMMGLLTTDWDKLRRWRSRADAFTAADRDLIDFASVSVFHPAVHFPTGGSFEKAMDWMEQWKRFVEFHPDAFQIVTDPSDLAALKRTRKTGVLLGMQDSEHFRTVDDVRLFFEFGQRASQLTYNRRNRIGCGCWEENDTGLSAFGVCIVEAMRDVGMLIDISHCGPRTSLDAIEAAGRGVVISHSNCQALVPGEPRCKSDEVIRKMAAAGGVIGITAISKFVSSSRPVTIEHTLDHFDHVAALVGVEHISLGSDAGIDGFERYVVPGLDDACRVYELTEGLLRRGYSADEIGLILGGNFRRVFGEAIEGPGLVGPPARLARS